MHTATPGAIHLNRAILEDAQMWVVDVVIWLLVPLVGIVVGLRTRWSALAMLAGFGLVLTSLALFGYSLDHYSNNDCEPGEPCSTQNRSFAT